MRFIIREQDYEVPLAAGRFRYERQGSATGAYESWRLTSAAAGYSFLRVDMDAREAESGESYLFHMTIDADGKPERLKFRVYGRPDQIVGDVLFEKDKISLSRVIGDNHLHETAPYGSNYRFWFPTTVGLALSCHPQDEDGKHESMSLFKDDQFKLHSLDIKLEWQSMEHMVATGQKLAVRPCLISWSGQWRKLWLDEFGWPVRMERHDGLSAIDVHCIRYKNP